MTHIYIAAKFSDRMRLRKLLPELATHGFKVTSRWITDDDLDFHEIEEPRVLETLAYRDVGDILAANFVVIDTLGELSQGGGGGREWEAGFGFSRHGYFYRVGEPRNPFHYLSSRSFQDWRHFIYGR